MTSRRLRRLRPATKADADEEQTLAVTSAGVDVKVIVPNLMEHTSDCVFDSNKNKFNYQLTLRLLLQETSKNRKVRVKRKVDKFHLIHKKIL